SGAEGVNVATCVVELYATVPATAVPEDVTFNVMFVTLIVVASIASLNVILTVVDGETPVAPFAGDTAVTVGCVSSRVVNVHVNGAAIAFPARSFTPLIVTVMLAGF